MPSQEYIKGSSEDNNLRGPRMTPVIERKLRV